MSKRAWIHVLSKEARLRIARLLLEEYGSPATAAVATGLSKSTISKYLKGQLVPSDEALEKIVNALHGVYRERALEIAYRDLARRLRVLEKELTANPPSR